MSTLSTVTILGGLALFSLCFLAFVPAVPKRCPNCRCRGQKVIYAGMPMMLCEDCYSLLWGFWSFIPAHFPVPNEENGYVFFVYSGTYPKALWKWLRG